MEADRDSVEQIQAPASVAGRSTGRKRGTMKEQRYFDKASRGKKKRKLTGNGCYLTIKGNRLTIQNGQPTNKTKKEDLKE